MTSNAYRRERGKQLLRGIKILWELAVHLFGLLPVILFLIALAIVMNECSKILSRA